MPETCRTTGYNTKAGLSVSMGVSKTTARPSSSAQTKTVTLEGAPAIEVYPLKASRLPAIYHEGDEYEFTGFLIRYEEHAEHQKDGNAKMHVYAFQIRHLREAQ